MDRQHNEQTPVIGSNSLVVIFAVLCLTVFALLGLSTVRADKRLADISAEAVANYYNAEMQAETILAQLRAGQMPVGVSCSNGIYSYACPISETQVLWVEVQIVGSDWDILRWQSISTAHWSESDSLNVWNGEN